MITTGDMGLGAVELLCAADDSKQWFVQDAEGLHAFSPDTSLGSLLALRLADFQTTVENARATPPVSLPGRVVAPADDSTEIWAAGVTYEVSRGARMDESREATLYERVYDADRPELFFKSNGWRVAGTDQHIGIRADSRWNVPEPELALVVNAHQEIVGFTICNDVSSRSIEAENPLYLPQAKCYRGSCALGPGIVPAWVVDNPSDLTISMRIERDHTEIWAGETSTKFLHRSFEDLVSVLFSGEVFPRGVILSTGTAAVPPPEFTLMERDVVTIDIESVGTLKNTVLQGTDCPEWSII